MGRRLQCRANLLSPTATKTGAPLTVSIILPVLNEAAQLRRCLDSVESQSYPSIIEVIVADGGSTDETRSVAATFEKVVIVDNPRRIRPAGLNTAIAAVAGEVIVRVDARTALESDYVERCVHALECSGAAIVGGQMRYEAADARRARGIVAAMTSRLGAGPAAFRREGGEARFVDTVYLGAFRTETIKKMGCYDEWSGGNEDAELAWRAQDYGGVYLDPAIKSLYLGREGLNALARQFYRYGHNRARTIRKHPRSLSYRQLAVPALFVGLLSPWRRKVFAAYVLAVAARGVRGLRATRQRCRRFSPRSRRCTLPGASALPRHRKEPRTPPMSNAGKRSPNSTADTEAEHRGEVELSLFTTAKPFLGHPGIIQRNALASWSLLRPRPEILLLGDEEGYGEAARESGAERIPELERNEFGTPLVSGLFSSGRAQGQRVACSCSSMPTSSSRRTSRPRWRRSNAVSNASCSSVGGWT